MGGAGAKARPSKAGGFSTPMIFFRKIGERRPAVVLAVLVALSVLSLVTGARATFVHRGIHRAVALTKHPFLKAKLGIESAAASAWGSLFGYAALEKENATLRNHAVELQESLADYAETRRENARLRKMMDFMRGQPRLTLEPVQVIESLEGMLTIDRGRIHGIERAMSVIAEEGVVGIVTEVDDLSAKVATLHHPDCKIGAMVMRNRLRAYDGVVHAARDAGSLCTMYYIDIKEEVRPGDLVVTSPESVFPVGYPIGVISAPPHNSGLWKWADITPEVDPYRLDEVYVVRRAISPPEEFAGPGEDASPVAQVLSRAPVLPDDRPIQERYAP